MHLNATAARRQRVPVDLQLIRCRALNGARANWMRRCNASGGFEGGTGDACPFDIRNLYAAKYMMPVKKLSFE
jgi:hypothetical protein